MPKVSIVIPNYNHAQFLKQRIDSILLQTYQDFELIILDDYSTDNSFEIIEKYRNEPKITHIIFNKVNTGSPFIQWRKGVELAQGEWIWIAESDDFCEPSFLKTLIEGAEKYPSANIAYCQSVQFFEDTKKFIVYNTVHELDRLIRREDTLLGHYLPFLPLKNASMAIFKKESYEKVSDEYLNYTFCGDWVFWCEMSQLGDTYISGKYLNYFRKHNSKVTNKAFQSGVSYKEELSAINYICKKNKISQPLHYEIILAHYSRFLESGKSLDKVVYIKVSQLFREKLKYSDFIMNRCIIYSKQFVKKMFNAFRIR